MNDVNVLLAPQLFVFTHKRDVNSLILPQKRSTTMITRQSLMCTEFQECLSEVIEKKYYRHIDVLNADVIFHQALEKPLTSTDRHGTVGHLRIKERGGNKTLVTMQRASTLNYHR